MQSALNTVDVPSGTDFRRKIMRIELYPKPQLEALWQDDAKLFNPMAVSPPKCLRCGSPLDPRLVYNPLSRYADIHIFSTCGSEEAMLDYGKKPLPFTQWDAAKNGSIPLLKDKRIACLKTECAFTHIFEKTKQIPLSSTPHPVSEIVYSRSDYDGHRWWTTWFDCVDQKPQWELVQEIDGFHNALFDKLEFRTLDTMKKFCQFAETTADPTEFNFYSETEHCNIWLRLITRSKDYNLYVHYYMK